MSAGATPMTRFKTALESLQLQLNEEINEMIMTADIIGQRPNYLTVDEQGFYHIQASGNIDDVITSLTKVLEKLNRIKTFREHN